MPEGHTLHRLATAVREQFAGRTVAVSSPQGRFAESARLVDGTELVTAESFGKHLFVAFAVTMLLDSKAETSFGRHLSISAFASRSSENPATTS